MNTSFRITLSLAGASACGSAVQVPEQLVVDDASNGAEVAGDAVSSSDAGDGASVLDGGASDASSDAGGGDAPGIDGSLSDSAKDVVAVAEGGGDAAADAPTATTQDVANAWCLRGEACMENPADYDTGMFYPTITPGWCAENANATYAVLVNREPAATTSADRAACVAFLESSVTCAQFCGNALASTPCAPWSSFVATCWK